MSSAVPPPPGHGQRWARRTTRASDLLLRTLYITTALFGLLVTPPMTMLLVVPAIPLGTVILLAGILCYVQQHLPSRRTLTNTASGTASLVPFGSGVAALQGLGDAIGLVILALLAVVGTSRINHLVDHATRPAPPRPAPPPTGTSRCASCCT